MIGMPRQPSDVFSMLIVLLNFRIDPNSAKRSTPSVLHELGSRIAQGIARFTACAHDETAQAHPSGFYTPVPYPQPPLSRYQSWLRAGNGDTVQYHYTRWLSKLVVER